MAILKEYVEILELGKEKPTKIYLPNVRDMYAIDNTEIDGSYEVTEEYCKIETKDGNCFIFRCPLSTALSLYKDIIRFRMAELLDIRTNKIFVY